MPGARAVERLALAEPNLPPGITLPAVYAALAAHQRERGRRRRRGRIRLRKKRYDLERLAGPLEYRMPATAGQLSKSIRELNSKGRRWLVRGGAHSYEATTLPSGNDATVIDMARFDGLRVDAPNAANPLDAPFPPSPYATVTFGAGVRLGQIYWLLAQQNLIIVAGTCIANGASGFMLGGGVGPTVLRHGWASDSVISARLVLADGSLAVAAQDDGLALPG